MNCCTHNLYLVLNSTTSIAKEVDNFNNIMKKLHCSYGESGNGGQLTSLLSNIIIIQKHPNELTVLDDLRELMPAYV